MKKEGKKAFFFVIGCTLVENTKRAKYVRLQVSEDDIELS